jgi:hypothetical protein
MEKP